MRCLISAFVIFIYSFAGLQPATSFTKSFNLKKDVPLQQGVFLVAAPELTDPDFVHTVILLVAYGEEGALGLIINRPSGIPLRQVLPDIKENDKVSPTLYSGGPVSRNNLFALFTSDKPLEGAVNALGNIYFSGNRDVIIPLFQNGDQKNKIRIYAGYAGWAPGQLEHEIMRGAWITVKASPEMIFSDDPHGIWPSMFKQPEEIIIWNPPLFFS